MAPCRPRSRVRKVMMQTTSHAWALVVKKLSSVLFSIITIVSVSNILPSSGVLAQVTHPNVILSRTKTWPTLNGGRFVIFLKQVTQSCPNYEPISDPSRMGHFYLQTSDPCSGNFGPESDPSRMGHFIFAKTESLRKGLRLRAPLSPKMGHLWVTLAFA
jgi:hypothetical protein